MRRKVSASTGRSFMQPQKGGLKAAPAPNIPESNIRRGRLPGRSITKTIQQDALGDETAYYVEMDGEKRYVIGDEILGLDDFNKQIGQRFGQAFPKAWERALQIVERTDRATLESLRTFYEEIYKPRRDELAKAWSALSKLARLCYHFQLSFHKYSCARERVVNFRETKM